ncbi:hypothetical protein [Ignatzschineria cameli]|uniref:hypothetical protein n=1 Tax=Ignatzschineria cameli TaxID=2182793 RepID=UPI000D654B12|nr:hypothetical protein [Ignatzschineria cameli]
MSIYVLILATIISHERPYYTSSIYDASEISWVDEVVGEDGRLLRVVLKNKNNLGIYKGEEAL